MMHGKREMPRKKSLTVLVALALILCCAVGGTVAFLATSSGPVTNTFTPSKVTTAVDEIFNGTTKEKVRIQNTGNTDAYIRAAIVVNWVDASGNIYGKKPVENTDYTLTFTSDSGWTKASDGFYYYNGKVAANGGFTANLIDTCKQIGTAPAEGYALQVTILADGIQADGMGASNAQEAFAKAAANS